MESYAPEDAALSEGALQAKIWVFVPGSTDRKDVSVGTLLSTPDRSADGREVFKGTLSLSDTFGATGGYLSVIGKNGVSKSMEV